PELAGLVILSQDVHKVFGGVVPELASRAHLAALPAVVERALAEAGVAWSAVDAVAVTQGPGLVGALLVGVVYAKALAYAGDRKLIGVHHMEGHLFAPALEDPDLAPPFVALLVSGGHTLLLDVPAWGDNACSEPRGTTRRAKPSTRWRPCWSSGTPAARRSSASPPRETPNGLRFRAQCGTTATSSPSQGSRPPCCGRSGRATTSRATGHTSRARFRTPSSTCSSPSSSARFAPPGTA